MKNTKRIISVITALTLLLALFAVMPSTLALEAEQNYAVNYRDNTNYNGNVNYYDDTTYATEFGTSLIAGKTATAVVYDRDANDNLKVLDPTIPINGVNVSKLSMLTDGKVKGTDKENYAQLYYFGGASAGNVSRLDLEYDLGTICEIDRFLMMGVNYYANGVGDFNYWAKLSIGQFEVYLSTTKEDLYNAENMIYSYQYSDDFRATQFDVTFNETEKGQYFAIRILNPVSVISSETNPSHLYPRIAEIGLYGEEGISFTETLRDNTTYNDSTLRYNNETYSATFGNSLIAGQQANVVVYDKDENDNLRELDPNVVIESNNVSKLSLITDNKVDGLEATDYAQLYYKNGVTQVSRMDLEYDLGGLCNVDRFFLMGPNHDLREGEYTYWSKLSIGEFEVYLSDSKTDLYNEDNLIYSYRYSDTYRATQFDVNYSKPVQGRYLAVRILNPTSNGNIGYPRISAIAVMGEKVETAEPGDVNADTKIDILDAVQLYKHLKDSSFTVANGDVDDSGDVDAADLTALRAMLLGK